MGKERSRKASLLIWASLATLLSQNLLIPVMCSPSFQDQKNYYAPDPHAGTPPTGSHTNPPSGGSYGGSPPYHHTPSHGGGSPKAPTPVNCGTPPSGGYHPKPTPSPPTGGHGGGYYTPPTTPSPTTPTPIITPPTPSVPTISPPTITPGTPTYPVPTPPYDPNSPPFTCIYWSTHPTLIWGLFGWWATIGGALGAPSVPGFGSNMNLLQALSNTHTDGYGELYREGTASLLNSMVQKSFTYTTSQVRDSFIRALSSDRAAGAQAQLFRLANEGRRRGRP